MVRNHFVYGAPDTLPGASPRRKSSDREDISGPGAARTPALRKWLWSVKSRHYLEPCLLGLLLLSEWLREEVFQSPSLALLVENGLQRLEDNSVRIVSCFVIYLIFLGAAASKWWSSRGGHAVGFSRYQAVRDACRISLATITILTFYFGEGGDRDGGSLAGFRLGIDQSTNAIVFIFGLFLSYVFENNRTIGGRGDAGGTGGVVIFLAAMSCVKFATPYVYYYHGNTRWSGPWLNPNSYGILMAVGMVLALGKLVVAPRTDDPNQRTFSWVHKLCYVLCALICLVGLAKSYSRGAWLGGSLGVLLLVGRGLSSSGRRYALIGLVTLCSLGVIGFWELRNTDSTYLHRVFSVANINDFSWRNRLGAWDEGVLNIVARPWLGSGWKSIDVVSSFDSQPDAPYATQLNDYITLAASAGVLALVLFLVDLAAVFASGPRGGRGYSPGSGIQAAIIPLVVGFALDGGLFKLAPCSVFWWLTSRQVRSVATDYTPTFGLIPKRRTRPGWAISYGVMILLVVLASALTGLHLILPRFAATARSVSLAERWIVKSAQVEELRFVVAEIASHSERLSEVLDYVDVADYNRSLVNWKASDEVYRQYVLSPQVWHDRYYGLKWRRALWERLYPWVRREKTEHSAALIVEQRLRMYPEAASFLIQSSGRGISSSIGALDSNGFDVLYIAGLRAVGVPARLGPSGRAEIWVDDGWHLALQSTASSFGSSL